MGRQSKVSVERKGVFWATEFGGGEARVAPNKAMKTHTCTRALIDFTQKMSPVVLSVATHSPDPSHSWGGLLLVCVWSLLLFRDSVSRLRLR